MRVLMLRAAIAASALVFLTSGAQAVCPGLSVLVADDFDDLSPAWGDAGPELTAESGNLLLSPGSGTDFWRIHSGSLHDDVDYCVNVAALRSVDPTESKAGAVFWYEDANNFYVAQLAPNGLVSIWRRQRGQWLEQLSWRRADAAQEGEGVVNEIRVTTRDDKATLSVNGSQVAEIEGRPPARGQLVGVFASSPVSGRAVFAFDSIRLTEP